MGAEGRGKSEGFGTRRSQSKMRFNERWLSEVSMEIKRTIGGAFGYVYAYRTQFAKALVLPVTVIVALGAIPRHDLGVALVLVLTAVRLLVYSILAITTHRMILLGPQAVAEWGVYLPQKREFYFMLVSIGMGLTMVPFGVLTLIPVIGLVVAVIGMVYTLARLSLVFPAIATDRRWSFADSWKATQSHQVLMIVVVGIFPFILSVPGQLLSHIPHTRLAVNVLSAFTMIFIVAALSVAFQVITGQRGESTD